MNTDLSPGELDPDEAVDIYNMLIHEPAQLRSRKGPTFKCAFPGTAYIAGIANNASPSAFASCTAQAVTGNALGANTRGIITFLSCPTASDYNHLLSPGTLSTGSGTVYAQSMPLLTYTFLGQGNTNTLYNTYIINADSANGWQVTCMNLQGASTGWEAAGQTAQYFGCAYYTSAEQIYRYWYPNFVTNPNPYAGTALFRWAGLQPPSSPKVWFYSLNNGALTGSVLYQFGNITSGVANATQTVSGDSVSHLVANQYVWIYDATMTTLRGGAPVKVSSVNVGAGTVTFTGSVTTTTGDIVATSPADPGATVGPAGYFMINMNDNATQWPYTYLITAVHGVALANTAATFSIDKPYGIGATVAQVPNRTYASTWQTTAIAPVLAAPMDVHNVHTYLNRLFVGRASLGAPLPLANGATLPTGLYQNGLAWSQAGNPEVWPVQNWALVDDNPQQSITGFATCGNTLLIFRQDSIFLMSGTDESNFSIQPFSLELGCLDGRSITPYRTGCIFMSRYGMYYTDGTQIRDLTQSKPAHGIRTAFRDTTRQFVGGPSGMSTQATTIIPGTDYALMSGHDASVSSIVGASGYQGDDYAMFLPGPNAQTISFYYIPNGSWFRFGNNDPTINLANSFWLYTTTGQHLNHKAVGFTQGAAYEMDRMVEAEFSSSEVYLSQTTNTALEAMLTSNWWTTVPAVGAQHTFTDYKPPLGYDYCIADNGAVTTSTRLTRGNIKIPLRIQYKDMMVGDGDTVRVDDIYVDHNCFYVASGGSLAPSVQGWNVSVAGDPELITSATQLSAIGAPTNLYNMVQPRYEGVQFVTTPPGSLYHGNYTSTPDGSQNWEIRAKTVRVIFDNVYLGAQTTAALSYKLFGSRLSVSTVMPVRVDNPVV